MNRKNKTLAVTVMLVFFVFLSIVYAGTRSETLDMNEKISLFWEILKRDSTPTWVGVVVNSVTLWFLWGTLRANTLAARAGEKAALAAEAAAKATEEANKTTREQFASSIRPWLKVEFQTIGDKGVQWEAGVAKINIEVRVHNIGGTPALRVRVRAECVSVRVDNTDPEAALTFARRFMSLPNDVFGDQIFHGDERPYNEEVILFREAIDGEKIQLIPFIAVIVRYEDPFSNEKYYTLLAKSLYSTPDRFTMYPINHGQNLGSIWLIWSPNHQVHRAI